MEIKCIEMNMFQENCYVVYDQTKEAVIIDPGCYFEKDWNQLTDFITSEQLVVKHLLNTHLHVDHIFGNRWVEEKYHVITEAHSGDADWLEKAVERCEMLGLPWVQGTPVKIGKTLTENDVITFGECSFHLLHVPGHSRGSLCFYNASEQVLFSGDVLFRAGVGRADLPGGDWNLLLSGIKNKLMVLPAATKVFPGHGPSTTIGWEKDNNPYF